MDDYLNYWGLAQAIFYRALPYGRMFIAPKRQKELQRLLLLARQPKTLQLVTAPAGYGKTTIAHWLYSSLDPLSHEGYVSILLEPQRAGTPWLLPGLNDFLIGKTHLTGNLWRATAKGLDQLADENRQLVVVVDAAAGHRHAAAWQELASLLDLSAGSRAACAVVVFGDEAVGEEFAKVPSLAERLSFHWALPAFERDETEQYLMWYLQQAGLARCPFNEPALKALYLHSQGIAARINSLGENCFIEAAFQTLQAMDGALVDKMAALRRQAAAPAERTRGSTGEATGAGAAQPEGLGPASELQVGSAGSDETKRNHEHPSDVPTRVRTSLFRE